MFIATVMVGAIDGGVVGAGRFGTWEVDEWEGKKGRSGRVTRATYVPMTAGGGDLRVHSYRSEPGWLPGGASERKI